MHSHAAKRIKIRSIYLRHSLVKMLACVTHAPLDWLLILN